MGPIAEDAVTMTSEEAEAGGTGTPTVEDSPAQEQTPKDPVFRDFESQNFSKELPGVRFCNWFQFKNRFAEEDFSNITIEALCGPPHLRSDMSIDEYRRYLVDKSGLAMFPFGLTDHRSMQRKRDDILHRVRLHSAAVLKRLGSIAHADTDWTGQPTTFVRPFRLLIYYHDKMKVELELIKTTATRTHAIRREYEEVQEYVNFVEEVLLPLRAAWDPNSQNPSSKIRHSDLCYIFRPGELLHYKKERFTTWNTPDMSSTLRMHISLETEDEIGVDTSHISKEVKTQEPFDPRWSIYKTIVYRIDYDGTAFRSVIEVHDIPWYEGEMEIQSLPIYPLRFAENADKLLAENREYGERFKNLCTGQPHWFHSGWTVSADDNYHSESYPGYPGYPGRPPARHNPVSTEFVDSEVIIDFREAMKALRYEPNFGPAMGSERVSTTTRPDRWEILIWDDNVSTRTQSTISENIVIGGGQTERLEEKELADRQSILRKGTASVDDLSDLQLALLPRRVLVYSLRDRKFVEALIDSLSEVRNTEGGFKNLRINQAHLRMIKSLVKNHFDTRILEAKKGVEMAGQDFIHGKGRGIVVLLHGVPGVGKTATAEAVAQEYSKPLFAITCGDLGTTPEAVSKSLMDIFRLANLWGCVLLLDEADVFLSRREHKADDLMRNALVSGEFAKPKHPPECRDETFTNMAGKSSYVYSSTTTAYYFSRRTGRACWTRPSDHASTQASTTHT
jgi:hypothetical protein